MDMIQMVLTLIRATRKTTLNYMSTLSVCLVPNVHCKRSQQLRTIFTCVTDYTHKFGWYTIHLSIGHNVDLELTLPFLLGPVSWSLSTPDRIYTKTDKSNFPHRLQSHIEPTLDWACSAAHNVDVSAVTTEHNSFSCHLHGSDGTSIQPGTKCRACWFCHWYIYTMYKQQSIKSYKHSHSG